MRSTFAEVFLATVYQSNHKCHSLRLDETKNNQTKGVKWAKDYEI
jgi:hypothetical protein